MNKINKIINCDERHNAQGSQDVIWKMFYFSYLQNYE